MTLWLTLYSIRYFLSERYRLRFEDAGIDDMEEAVNDRQSPLEGDNDGHAVKPHDTASFGSDIVGGTVRTLDGEVVGDEFAQDAMDYQILLGQLDVVLERLNLDA